MKLISLFTCFGLGLAAVSLAGCGQRHETEAGHAHDGHEHHDHDHAHDDDHHHETSAAGAAFEQGKGVILADETRRSLGVETAEVVERNLPLEIRFTAQVFGENHRPTADEMYHVECTAKGSGLLPQEQAALIRPGTPAQFQTRSGGLFGGFVLGVSAVPALRDAEIVLGVTNAAAQLKPGDFVSATVAIEREQPVMAIPETAVLRTAEGAFAYKQNGEAYLRVGIQTGARAQGFAEVTHGLAVGDVVVAKPVENLWLIELRATKGGGHIH